MSATLRWKAGRGSIDQPFHAMIGQHPLMLSLFGAIERAAALRVPVLIEGETGVGKDLVAQALHALSGASGSLIALNVATLPENLVESELFGAVRGAFTGAGGDREGVIGAASGGTLFLDEAGELDSSVQAKLLRTLEAGGYRPVGASRERRASFRLVMTTQEPPHVLLADGRWRRDFYYRVAGISLAVPPLRARPTDIPYLAARLLNPSGLAGHLPSSLSSLSQYSWPGNIRQLQRAIERAAFEAGKGPVTAKAILVAARAMDPGLPSQSLVTGAASGTLRAHEREQIVAALESMGSAKEAAGSLGLSVHQFYRRLRRHKLPVPTKLPALRNCT